jgi:outer membrane protein TolC
VVNTVYTTGKSTLNDVVKIQIEIDRIENDLVEFKEKRNTMHVRLNKLLNISEGFVPVGIEELKPVALDYVKEELLKDGEEGRTEIRSLVAKLEKMQLLIEMAEKRFYPDFTPGFSLFQNRIIKQVGTDAQAPTFSNMPMVRGANWFGSNDAYIRETKIKYQALQDQIKGLKNKTVDATNQAVFRYENADRLRTLFASKLVPKSRLTVDITETMYITGKVDFMDLINSQQMFLSHSLSLKRAIKDMNVEAARIERLVGSTIKKKMDGERSTGG